MKKTYISPNMVAVQLAMTNIIALSNGDTMGLKSISADNGEDALVNEYKGTSDVNVWDDEW